MKVLFLSTWFPYPPDNGSKLRAYHLLRALGNRHEVTLLSFTFDTARPDKTDALQAICTQRPGGRAEPVCGQPGRRAGNFSLRAPHGFASHPGYEPACGC